MKKLVLPLIGLVVVLAAIAGYLLMDNTSADRPPVRGAVEKFVLAEKAPAAPLTPWRDGDGAEQRLADYRGKVVLVNYWATWCAPCIREMPSLARLQKALPSSEFALVAISVDLEGRKVAEPFLQENDLTALGLHLDNRGTVARAMGVSVMPTSILYDRDGREVGRLSGAAEWDSADALALIRFVINRKPAG
jgi:thiol-disulfide isomerase/thioredoxin